MTVTGYYVIMLALKRNERNKMNIQIGDIYEIGIGTFNIDTGKNSEYVRAEVIGLNAYDDKNYFKLEMLDLGGPFLKEHKCYLTKKLN